MALLGRPYWKQCSMGRAITRVRQSWLTGLASTMGAVLGIFTQESAAMPLPDPAAQSPDIAPSPMAAPDDLQAWAKMRGRDRRARPAGELAAWQAFAHPRLTQTQLAPELRAELHLRLAIAHYYNKDYAQAHDQAEAAAALLPQLKNWPLAPELAAYRALILVDLNRYDEAQARATQALQLARAAAGEDSAGMAYAYNAQAMLDYARGDYPAAASAMCLSAQRAKDHLPPADSMVAGSMLSCGIYRYNLDDDSALDTMREAATLAYAHLRQDNTIVAMALNGSGGALLQLGRYAEAEEVIRREIDVERAIYGKDDITVYYPLSLLARVLELQGKLEDAEAVFRQAAEFIHRADAEGSNPELRGNSWVNLGVVLEKRGKLADALAMQRKALDELTAQLPPDHESLPQARRHIARLLWLTGNLDQALPLARQSVAELTQRLGPNHRATLGAQGEYARMLDASGQQQAALAMASKAAALLETRLLDLAARRADMVAFSQVSTLGFSNLAYIALRAGQAEAAVRAAQLASLSELSLVSAELTAAALGRDKGLSAQVEQLRSFKVQERQLQADLARAEGGDGDPLPVSRQSAATRTKIAAIEAELAKTFPDFAALSRPRPVSLAQIKAQLGPHAALILPLSLPDRLVTMAITRQGVRWGEAAGSQRELSQLADKVRASVDAGLAAGGRGANSFDLNAAHALYRAVLPGNLAHKLADKREWRFPASGPLASLSPALLLASPARRGRALAAQDWLVRHHSLAVQASLTRPAPSARPAHQRGFAGIGAPVLAKDAPLPPLPHAAQELAALAQTLAPQSGQTSLLLTGEQARESIVKAQDFRAYSIIAFATHGLTSAERGALREPALVLTPEAGNTSTSPESAQDGLLTASEIAQLAMPADWVILSACNSGAGSTATAPSYSGLARAFRMAGARSLLLSHWPVRDDAAARLTTATLRHAARGAPRPEALRRAMLEMMADKRIKKGAHPAAWAPFVLIED